MIANEVFPELANVDAAQHPDRAQSLLNAGCAEAVRLVQQPSRSALDAFLRAARAAFVNQSSRVADGTESQPAYCLGQLGMLVEMVQAARLQKIPEEALSALSESDVKRSIVKALVTHGRLRMRDLAEQLGKYPQNLVAPVRELAQVGLVERQELGRTVFLSATPLGTAASEPFAASTPEPAKQPTVSPPQPAGSNVVDPRALVLSLCERVQKAPPGARYSEAQNAAAEFARHRALPQAGGTALPRSTENRERHLLLNKIVECESYLLRNADLPLFGEDPVSYLPGVLAALNDGIALNVIQCVDWTERMIGARVMPGGTSAQLLGVVTDRVRAQSMKPATYAGV